ncbi:MAG: LysE family transporter, partial [bacterium]|nr:LysE family transporter [bacterium]
IDSLIRLITYAGAAVLLIMGIREWQSSGEVDFKTSSKPFQKSLILDFINPHAYIFWFTILAPPIVAEIKVATTMNAGSGLSFLGVVNAGSLFWAAFVGGLISTKLIMVFLANQIKSRLKSKHIKVLTKFIAFCLIFFALKLVV